MLTATLSDAELDALTDVERAEYAKYLEALVGGEGLRDFMVRMTPHHTPPKHLDPIIDALEEARTTRLGKWLIDMPPGHGKTTVFLNAFAWWLTKFPADTCSYSSYNQQQANDKSVIARDLAIRAGVRLSEDINTKAIWRTPQGGGLLAGMSGLTGKRTQGPTVVDDPYAGPMDAYSKAYRDESFSWIQTVPVTRREGAPLFLVHTRWHEDDAIGRFKKQGGWKVIHIPAINDLGQALWEEMYPLADLQAIREVMGEYNFAALYQGAPRPRGGNLFGDATYYDASTLDLTGCRIVIAADPAASEKTSSDYSAAVVLAIRGEGPARVAYVLEVYRKQVPIPVFVGVLADMQARHGNARIHVEAVGGFKAVPQMLRALGLRRISEIDGPIGDKFTRAQSVSAAWNGGRVLVPAYPRTPGGLIVLPPAWLGPFLDELADFTGVKDKFDDQTDALAHGWNASEKAAPPPPGAPRIGGRAPD